MSQRRGGQLTGKITMTNYMRLLAACTCLLVLFGCASKPTTKTDFDPAHDFSNDIRIGFYSKSGEVTGDNPMDLTDFQKRRIDDALAKALTSKGFTMVDNPKDADLLLSWHLNTFEKQDIRTTTTPSSGAMMGVGMGMGYNRYNRYALYNCFNCMDTTDVRVREYTQGTFILDMIDPGKNKSVWRNVTQSELKGEALKSEQAIDNGAQLILADFPPK